VNTVRRRRVLAGAIFLTAILAVTVGVHLYLGQRLALDPAWPGGVRRAFLSALALGFAVLLLYPFLRRRLPAALGRAWAWCAFVWMGFSFLLFTATGASDGLLWLLGAAAPSGPAGDLETLARVRAVGVVGLAAAVAVVSLRSALAPPRVCRHEIALARWPRALDGFRIAQVSDLHIGPLLDRRFASDVVARVNALQPDLVAVTGDLVDGSVRRLRDEVAPFSALRARHGVFFVTGNHDYYSGVDEWIPRVRELGWRALRNQRVAIEAEGAGFDLAGVDDHHGALFGAGEGEDLERALADRDPRRALVLLAHDPASFRAASARGVDLQLSGHTHGGQIWPFRWVVRLTVPWVAGLYRVGGSVLYVSRGTGFWGPPMRLLAPAEISEIVLRCGGAEPAAAA
jgi:predicted MPP superfamily phosphohydrolase